MQFIKWKVALVSGLKYVDPVLYKIYSSRFYLCCFERANYVGRRHSAVLLSRLNPATKTAMVLKGHATSFPTAL